MPIHYKIHPQAGLVIFEPTESFGLEEIIATNEDILANPLFHRGMNSLWKTGPGTLDRLNWDTLVKIRDFALAGMGEARTRKACIVAPADLEYGMARMMQILSEGVCPCDMRAFRSLDEALSWLGAPDPWNDQ